MVNTEISIPLSSVEKGITFEVKERIIAGHWVDVVIRGEDRRKIVGKVNIADLERAIQIIKSIKNEKKN